MRKLLLSTILLMATCVQAQDFWTEVAPFGAQVGYVARQISIVDASTVWVWGNTSVLSPDSQQYSISNDGGLTWTHGAMDLPMDNMVTSLHAISATTAYRTTYSLNSNGVNGLWRTTDAGQTWTPINITGMPTEVFPNFVHFFDANHGLVVCDPNAESFQIYHTSNAGATWNAVSWVGFQPPLYVGEFGYNLRYRTKGNAVWFGTNSGRLFRSTNLGVDWIPIQSPVTDFGGAIQSATFDYRNNNEGLLVSNDFQYFRTLDGGITWMAEFPETTYRNFETIFVTNTNNTYFAIGQDFANQERGSSYSTDGGLTWIDLNEIQDDPVIPTTARFASGTVGFCIGSYESDPTTVRFYRLTDPLNRLKSKEFNQVRFTVSPNPVKDVTRITASGTFESVTVTDLTGKTVLTQNVNATETALDLSGLQTGIYVAKISAENGAGQSIKIIKQ